MPDPALHGLTRGFAHGRAFSEVLAVSDPAAGGGFTYQPGGRYVERLAAVAFRVVTDGTAGNRTALLSIQDQDGVNLAAVAAGGTQAASLTRDYSFLPNISQATAVAGNRFTAPLPDLFLQPEYRVVVTLDNVQAGDQVSRVRLFVERFDTNPDFFPVGMVDETRAESRRLALGS